MLTLVLLERLNAYTVVTTAKSYVDTGVNIHAEHPRHPRLYHMSTRS